MGLRLIWGAIALMGLAACDGGQDYPSLLPTDQVMAEPPMPAHAQDVATAQSVGAALDARSRRLGRTADAGTVGTGDLQRRAAQLRDRARVLAAQTPQQQECPQTQPDCTAPSTAQD